MLRGQNVERISVTSEVVVEHHRSRRWALVCAALVVGALVAAMWVVRTDRSLVGTTPAVATAGCPGTITVRPTGSGPAAQIRQWSTQPGTDTSGWHGEAGMLEVHDDRTVFVSDAGFSVRVFAIAVSC